MTSTSLAERFPWLGKVADPASLDTLSAAVGRRTLPRGARFQDEGTVGDTLAFLLGGSVRLRVGAGDRAVHLGEKHAGDFFGETWMIDPAPVATTVEAIEDCALATLDHAGYARLREESPRAAGAVLSGVCCDLARRIRRSSQMARSDRSERPDAPAEAVAQLSALEGAARRDVDALWTPRSARGHATHASARDVVGTLERVGAFRAATRDGPEYAAALRGDVERIAPSLRVQEHSPGDVVIREGTRADGVFVVLEGTVRVQAGSPGAWFRVDREVGPGTVFGLIAFFDDGTRSATCSAATRVRLAVLYPAAVQALLYASEGGQPMGIHLIDWFARQLVADARALDARLRARLQTG